MGVQWDITMAAFTDGRGTLYKVTRRLPELSVAQTRVFRSRAAATRQFRRWLREHQGPAPEGAR